MNAFKCRLPQTHFGAGKLEELGDLVRHLGKKAMLCIDPFLDQSGLSEHISAILEKDSVVTVKWNDVQPNPSCFAADQAAARAREEKCSLVIGVGGGSSMDFGKAVAVVAVNPGTAWQYTQRSDQQMLRPLRALPLVAVPTTAGTGSEATPFAVLTNPEIREKSTIVSDTVFPQLALVDPLLTRSMPPKLTATIGFDALAHAMEAYISLQAGPFSDLLALETIRLVSRYLPEVVANGDNGQAREAMAWAATLGGAALAHTGGALPHALAQPIGGWKGIAHGRSIAALMVKVLELSYRSSLERFADVAVALEPAVADRPLREKARLCSELVQRLLEDININVRLSNFGIGEKDIDKLAHLALSGYRSEISSHPLKIGEEEIKRIYRECL